MILCAAMSWLAFWALPLPDTSAPGGVMLAQAGTLFAAGVAASGVAGVSARTPGIVLICIAAFIGTACLNNGEAAYGAYALLACASLASGAALLRLSIPLRTKTAVAPRGA